MKTVDLSSWDEFQEQLSLLQVLLEEQRVKTGLHVSEPVYRGQSNHRWPLETTLERYGHRNITLRDYYLAALKSKHPIESYTGKRWDIPTVKQYEDFLVEHDTFMFAAYPGYEYLVYLRHHGFPSPLLDWSLSPFVAAFFAFDAADETEADGRVSIFVFCEFFGSGKVGSVGSPEIQTRGPYVTSHPRHFKQQSSYTICIARSEDWHYTPHERAFTSGEKGQDELWKFTIPYTERRKVLHYLDSHNLNAYSLFDSEESLMSTMATRELYLNVPPT